MPDIDRFGRSERDYSRPSTPIQSGGSRGEFSDRLYTGRNPFIQPFGDDFSNVNTPRAGVPTMPMAMPSQAGIGFDRAGQARRFGPPAAIGFDRAGPSRFGPPANIGYDRAGAGIFGGGGSSAYAANDIVDAIMGGMNRSQQDEGFEVAGMTTDDRTERNLWAIAVNSFPVGTPDMQIQQKWEELKQDYYNRKYGGGSDTVGLD